MVEPAATISALMASWFTPSSLFIFVNLVIGTIAITCRLGAPKRQIHELQLPPHHSPQLVRSPSLLDRVRSFSLGHYEPTAAETGYTQPQLVRNPFLLERLKSFNFGLYKYEATHVETETEIEYVQPQQPESENPCPNPDYPQEPQLARTPSFLQQLQSMNFSRFYRSDSIDREKEAEAESDSNPGGDSKMKKSASERAGSKKGKCKEEEDEGRVERRRPATARSEKTLLTEEDEEVDAKADDFIKRFKKQLRLQRVDSIRRNKEMLGGN